MEGRSRNRSSRRGRGRVCSKVDWSSACGSDQTRPDQARQGKDKPTWKRMGWPAGRVKRRGNFQPIRELYFPKHAFCIGRFGCWSQWQLFTLLLRGAGGLEWSAVERIAVLCVRAGYPVGSMGEECEREERLLLLFSFGCRCRRMGMDAEPAAQLQRQRYCREVDLDATCLGGYLCDTARLSAECRVQCSAVQRSAAGGFEQLLESRERGWMKWQI
ncbi:hypothetical protein BKA65DRAFT_144863 [Rhexocercosporidium sp. MPI-PUGE-AT-0058]|nr:hypothetical protein BKA65DRAFT_144863 [Rhexocercosporidium sp. MPI-PUGE-AT-0058]